MTQLSVTSARSGRSRWHSYGTFRVPAFWIENTLVLTTARILATALSMRGASLHMIAVIVTFAVLPIGMLARGRRATSIALLALAAVLAV